MTIEQQGTGILTLKKAFSSRGFTIVETMVAMALSGILMAGVYSAYYSQQKTSVGQNQVAAMQQNLRAAMYFITTEIRMAGYDPVGSANAGIKTATSTTMRITMDFTDNAGTGGPDGLADDDNEDVTFSLYDSDSDGINDLGRNIGSGNQLAAKNIDALNFVYLDEEDTVTTTLTEIRSVQISLVARTGRGDPGYTNSESYSNQQGEVIYPLPGDPPDSYRRRLLTAQVKCRNIGLE